ncbi:Helix-turn-helix domain protein [compost metagenome]
MTDKKKADQQVSPKKMRIHDTSGHAQRVRLLNRLKLGPVDTFTAIQELNIPRPDARVAELRAAGHQIQTQHVTLTDHHGRAHHGVALFYLNTVPWKGWWHDLPPSALPQLPTILRA